MPTPGWKKAPGYNWGDKAKAKRAKQAAAAKKGNAEGPAISRKARSSRADRSQPQPLYPEEESDHPAGDGARRLRRRADQSPAGLAPGAAGDSSTSDNLQNLAMAASAEMESEHGLGDVGGAGGGVVHDDDAEAAMFDRAGRIDANSDDDDEVDEPPDVGADAATPQPFSELDARRSQPLVEVSATLARRGEHVFPAWCDAVHRFIQAYCEAGAVALERGKKQQWLHCQIVLRLHWDPTDLEGLKAVIKSYCGIVRGDGLGSVFESHVFREGQNWITMLGYLHKDRLKPHFRVLVKNVTEVEIQEGIKLWMVAALSIEDGKTILTKTGLLKTAHAHMTQHNAKLADATLLETLTDMMNDGTYLPNMSFLSGPGGGLRHDACETVWRSLKGDKNIPEADVRGIFFGSPPKTYGTAVNGERYYDVPAPAELQPTEGFLSEHNDPMPPATREGLGSFAQDMIARNNRSEAGSSADAP